MWEPLCWSCMSLAMGLGVQTPVLCFHRRYFELCFGEVRIRTDLQKGPGFQPPIPEAPREADGSESRANLTLKPSLLRLLSQVRHWLCVMGCVAVVHPSW